MWHREKTMSSARCRLWFGVSFGLLVSCHGELDLSIVPRTSGEDMAPGVETGSGSESADCAMGTVSNCAFCGDVCAGVDDDRTSRQCNQGSCTLFCHGEFYDVNGALADGCEQEDLPVHDSALSALELHLPDVDDPELATNPLDLSGAVYGDLRLHDPPELRPLGREDWYRVTTEGIGRENIEMMACLGIVNFPESNRFEVCISDSGASHVENAACGVAAGGGDSTCVSPPEGGDLGGPYLVRVRKLEGENTDLRYALFMAH